MLAWDHNAYYHRPLLDRLPDPVGRVLDVGCGTGGLASTLAARAAHVDAIDRDPGMIDAARHRVPGNVTCLLGDVLERPLDPAGYDAIVSVSALHHLDLGRVLPLLAGALRPGGVLAAVALPRTDLPRELAVEAAATVTHVALGTALHLGRHPLARSDDPSAPVMPMRDPVLTVRQVRSIAASVLPGARVRRLLLWRYLLVWHRPGT